MQGTPSPTDRTNLSLPEFILRIVVSGNDERRDLDPDAEFLIQTDRVQHRLQPRTAYVLVEIIGESLEIDVCRVEDGLISLSASGVM